MRIPNYYCPRCRRFRKWYQRIDSSDVRTYCRYCGEELIYVKDFLIQQVECMERSMKRKNNNNSKSQKESTELKR